MNRNVIIIVIITGFGVASCHHPTTEPTDTPTSGEISISVDQTFAPILKEEIRNFESEYDQAKIDASYKNETDAVADLLANRARIIVIPRMLTPDEMKYFQQMQFNPPQVKIGYDAIAFVVNRENADSNITYDEVTGILNGSISTWNQLNPKSTIGDISLVFDSNNSSTLRYVEENIIPGKTLMKNSFAADSNPGVIDYVSKNKSAIGVIGVNWISERADSTANSFLTKVTTVGITRGDSSGDKAFYQPYQYYILQGDYPFIRSVYAISREPRTGLGTGFATYLASDEGQRIILRAGLVPATQPVRVIELQKNF